MNEARRGWIQRADSLSRYVPDSIAVGERCL